MDRRTKYCIYLIIGTYFCAEVCESKVIVSKPGILELERSRSNINAVGEPVPSNDTSGKLLDTTLTSGFNVIEQAVVNVWTQYSWLILQMIAFWAVLIIKAAIVWIIWWWFYYGKNGGLYGGGGYNGLVVPDMSYLNFKDKGRPSYNAYGKIDSENSGFSSFIFNAIDTLTKKFG